MTQRILTLLTTLLISLSASSSEIESVLAHAPFDSFYTCSEHYDGEFKELGDALGTDCIVQHLNKIDGRMFSRSYIKKGLRNEDWYGWNHPIQSPCDCEVVEIHVNPVVNSPGILGKPPASAITFIRSDGVHFIYAHIQNTKVKVGTKVVAGQIIGHIGNNGISRFPHVHVGAWQDGKPLQIRWDQRTMRVPPGFSVKEK